MSDGVGIGLYSANVLLHEGLQEATVFISDGKINAIVHGPKSSEVNVLDCHDDIIMPGLIDPHVHINEPGRTHWEGFKTATSAAAAGGITTLIDMPLNSDPVTVNSAALQLKQKAAKGKCIINCGFYGGVIPQNIPSIAELGSAGIFGIKGFLTHSGIDEFPNVTKDDLDKVAPILQSKNIPLLLHCELSAHHAAADHLHLHPKKYNAYLNSRPSSWETNAIELAIDICETYDIFVHIVHVSASESLDLIRRAKDRGAKLTAETCPHYLFFSSEEIEDGNTLMKCAPPIRNKQNQNKLWLALEDDTLDFIATDHSPAPPALKELTTGNFEKAWGGISSLQYSLPSVWTGAVKRGWSIKQVHEKMSYAPSKFLRLNNCKGRIDVGYDADLVVFDPHAEFEVSDQNCFHRHPVSAYDGVTLTGRVRRTFCRGCTVFVDGAIVDKSGDLLTRRDS